MSSFRFNRIGEDDDDQDASNSLGEVNLGAPIPTDQHAVSVSLPTWADVVGYEEGDPAVISKLTIGYPRFRIHDDVARLAAALMEQEAVDTSKWTVMCLPAFHVMQRFINYIQV